MSCCDVPYTEVCRALLEAIATGLVTTVEAVHDYMEKTLLYHFIDNDELDNMVKETLHDLEETGLTRTDDCTLHATLLGQATVASSLTPEDGLFVHKELRKALEAFVMDGEMHVLYSFTPIQAVQGNVNWQMFRNEVETFDESNLRALSLIGLKPAVINRMLVVQTRSTMFGV